MPKYTDSKSLAFLTARKAIEQRKQMAARKGIVMADEQSRLAIINGETYCVVRCGGSFNHCQLGSMYPCSREPGHEGDCVLLYNGKYTLVTVKFSLYFPGHFFNPDDGVPLHQIIYNQKVVGEFALAGAEGEFPDWTALGNIPYA